jgi:flagellar hook protein FlgE
MGFQQGLSGLNASSRALDVIGNNVANANTVGFKESQMHFADLFANALGGGAGQVGIGATAAAVAQSQTQGNVTATANQLDIAIKGQGYFRMQRNENDQTASFTRNGQFHLNESGYIVNDQGFVLMGIQGVNGTVPTSATPGVLRVNAFQIQPSASTTVELNLNLPQDDDPTGAGDLNPIASFDPADVTTYNGSSAMTLYDSEGVAHTLTMYYLKTADAVGGAAPTPATWDLQYRIDTGAPADAGNLEFTTTGQLATPAGGLITLPAIPVAGANDLALTLDVRSMTQYGSPFAINSLIDQTGYPTGNLSGLSIGADGLVQGRYSNGKTQDIGRITLASFRNPSGLAAVGNNQWVQTAESGQPTDNQPGVSTAGTLQAGAVEDSNVDLTRELVSMITMQRAYQANAQTIKTQDSVLQTITNLR